MENKYPVIKSNQSVRKSLLLFLQSVLMVCFLFSTQQSFATHSAGAELSYRWLSSSGNASTYEVTGTFYRDCFGVAAPTELGINVSSVSCGRNFNATIFPISGTGQEITFPCSTSVTKCSNTSSTNPGFQKYVYRGIVTLPVKCADWVLSYEVCCRNCAITTMSQPSPCNSSTVTTRIYVEATLNNLAIAHNNSPTFLTNPVAFICLGQSFTYNHGGTDGLEGDSLVYELINAKRSATQNIPYVIPFSGTNPLTSTPAVAINPATGDITMNPTAIQVGVVAIRIREYRGGVLIGSVIRDMQFIVRSCGANNLPTVTGINGTANTTATVCAGSTISFTMNTNDIDIGQTDTLIWDGGIPGATFSIAGTPHPTGTFTWNTTLANARTQPYQFTVTVRDNNCPENGFQTRAFTIFCPLISVSLTPSINNGSNVSCNGGSDGTILATPSGGTAPYTYSWTTAPVQTTQTATGLGAGTYNVTVTDSNNCSNIAAASITLTQPTPLTSSVTSQSNVNCFGDTTGSATALASGGTPGYSYSWNSAPVQNTAAATGLVAGTYTCTITDLNNCTTTVNATITQPSSALVSVVTDSTNVSCNGNDNGAIDLTVTGGTGPYTYLWTPGNITTEDLADLDTGTYTVVVTDSLGCTTSSSTQITQPGALVPLISVDSVGATNIACYGGTTGSATAYATGGTVPYSFLWTPSGDTTQTITGLGAGAISVLVTDANGCTGNAASLLTQPDSLESDIPVFTVFNITCNGSSDGSFNLVPFGGTPPYTFLWSSSDTTEDLTNIPAGFYSVTITDANGCTATDSITIEEPDTLIPVISSPTNAGGYNIGCHGESSGSVDLDAGSSGGTPPLTYLWSNGATSQSISNLTAGTYTVTVTDLNGCFDTASIILTEPDTIVPLITSVTFNGGVNITCSGNSDGTDSVFVSGGTAPYSYAWSSGDTLAVAVNLPAGPISVHIVDVNGCSADASDTLLAPDALIPDSINVSIFYGGNNVACSGSTNGTVEVFISGGSTPYSYVWYDTSGVRTGDTASTLIGLSAGSYWIVTTDANGCFDSSQVDLSQPDTLNPNADITDFNGFQIRCFGDSSGAIDLNVTGGSDPYTYSWSTGDTTEDLSNLQAGTYTVTVTDTNGCAQNFSFTLTEPTLLSVTDTVSLFIGGNNISCNGFFDGSILLRATGGVPSYSYLWAPNGETTDSLFSLEAGTYTYTVTDTNGCEFISAVTLTEPTPISIIDSVSDYNTYNISCNGGNNGCIFVSASGGTPGYTYSWSNELGGDSICDLTAGEYAATVTDTNGCIGTLLVTLIEPDSMIIDPDSSSYNGFNISCNGQLDGFIDLTVTGGVLGYLYYWSPAIADSLTEDVSGLPAGTYSVFIVDANGCNSDTVSVTLNEPPAFSVTLSSTPTACGLDIGTVTASVSGAVPPYTYLWDTPNADTTATVDSIPSAVYTVIVTDSVGCTYTDFITVGNAANLSATDTTTHNICNGGTIGASTVYPTGGTAPFTYLWTTPGADTTASVSGLAAGSYDCTVTDSAGCTYTITVTVTEPPPLVFSAGALQNVCGNSVTMTATVPIGFTGTWTVITGSGSFTGGVNNPVSDVDGLTIGTNVFQWMITDGVCSDSDTVVVTAYSPITANVSPGQSVCSDSATIIGNSIPGYVGTWTVVSGSGNFAPTINDSLVVVNGMTPGTNVYLWTLTNGACTDSASVTVDYAPFFANAGADQNICGDSTALGGNIITGFSGTWTIASGTGTIAGNTNPAASVTSLGVGNNVFVWTMTNGVCTASDSVTLQSFTPVTVTAGAYQSVCPDTANITATTVSGYSGTWTPILGSGSFSPSNTSASAQVTGMTPGTNIFEWTITNGVCSASATDTVFYDPAVSNPGSNTPICVTNYTMTGSLAPGYTGIWTLISGGGTITNNTSPTTTITNLSLGPNVFQWAITNGSCSDSDVVTIDVSAAVTANAGSAQSLCTDTAFLSASLIPGYSGAWTVVSGSGTFSNAGDSASSVTNMTPGNNSYRWTIGNGICTAFADVIVTYAPPQSDPGADDTTCGDSYTMNGTLAAGYTGVWTVVLGTGTFGSTTNPTTTVTNLTIGQTNVFQWTITNGTCTDSNQVTIESSNRVTASAGSDSTICKEVNPTYGLSASSPQLGSGFWTVVTGTGTVDQPTLPNATLTPSVGNNVLVWTVVNGACANSDSVSIVFETGGECFDELELPTAFSPNGDAYNPAYVIHGIDLYPENSFKVFNRWGNEVFSKDNYQNLPGNMADWFGQNNSGDPLPEGTYFVVLVLKNSNLDPPTRNTYVDLRR